MDKLNTTRIKSTSLALIAIVVVLAALSYSRSIVNPLLMAFFTVIILVQPIRWLVKKKVPTSLAVLIVILGLLGTYLAFFEILVQSWSIFVENAPKYGANLDELTGSTLAMMSDLGINIASIGESNIMDPAKIMSYTAAVVDSFGEIMSRNFIFLIFTIFLLTEIRSIQQKRDALSKGTSVSKEFLRHIGDSIRHYLSIKTVTSLLTGVLLAIGLAIIGVDYAILWGFVAFLLNYIPTIGSIIAAIPAIAFALVQMGFEGVLYTGILFLAVNVLVGNGIEPKMMGKGMGLSTFAVFFALIFWGFILGPIGMFLSVPLTIFIKLIAARNPGTKWVAIVLGTDEDAAMVSSEE